MTQSPIFLRREQAPLDSLLKGQTVLYRLDGRLWRCSEATWKAMGSNKLYTSVVDLVRDIPEVSPSLVKSLERRIKAKEKVK